MTLIYRAILRFDPPDWHKTENAVPLCYFSISHLQLYQNIIESQSNYSYSK